MHWHANHFCCRACHLKSTAHRAADGNADNFRGAFFNGFLVSPAEIFNGGLRGRRLLGITLNALVEFLWAHRNAI